MTVIEEAKIVLDDGTTLNQWSSYTIASDFLIPTDGWSFEVGGENIHAGLLRPDSRVQVFIDGTLQLTGIIDYVEFKSSASGGTTCSVGGRDVLRTLCKANIWPGFKVKGLTVMQMVEKVLGIYYPGNVPMVFYDDMANRKVLGLKGSISGKDRSAKQKAIIENSQAHPNEGAFEFLSRNLRRFGLWIWATADGNIVVSGPEYDQEPSYNIVRKRGITGANWPEASYRWDRSDVPTYLVVRGKATSKEWEKSNVNGSALDPNATSGIIEPAYIQHDESATKAQCEAFALQEMTRLKQGEKSYTVTCTGHRDRETGNIFAINTLAIVDDFFNNVHETMYVAGRTFRKDLSGGTTTELRCVPLGAIQFSDVDYPG